MSYDLQHRDIYSKHRDAVTVDGISVIGDTHTLIYAEENGDFMVSVSVKKCDIDTARMHVITINKEMLAAMNAAAQ